MIDRACHNCRYWVRLSCDAADLSGVCYHQDAPWATQERTDLGMMAPCMEAQESCALHGAADGAT